MFQVYSERLVSRVHLSLKVVGRLLTKGYVMLSSYVILMNNNIYRMTIMLYEYGRRCS